MPNYKGTFVVYGTLNCADQDEEETWTSQPMTIGQTINHIKQVMYDEVYCVSSIMFIVVKEPEKE